jgi:hypothetical protein
MIRTLRMRARSLGSPPPVSKASGGEGSGVGGSCSQHTLAEQINKGPPTRLASLATLPTALTRGGRDGASGLRGARP